MKQKRDFGLLYQKNMTDTEYYRKLEEVQLKKERLTHDLTIVMELTKRGEWETVQKTLEDLCGELKWSGSMAYTPSKRLNAMLSEKKEQAGRQGVGCSVLAGAALDVDLFEENRILGFLGYVIDCMVKRAVDSPGIGEVHIRLDGSGDGIRGGFQVEYRCRPVKQEEAFKNNRQRPGRDVSRHRRPEYRNMKKLAERSGGYFKLEEGTGGLCVTVLYNPSVCRKSRL